MPKPIETRHNFMRALRTAVNQDTYDMQLCYIPQPAPCPHRRRKVTALGLFHFTGTHWWDPATVVWDAFYRGPGESLIVSIPDVLSVIGISNEEYMPLWEAMCEDKGHDKELRAKALKAAKVEEVSCCDRVLWREAICI